METKIFDVRALKAGRAVHSDASASCLVGWIAIVAFLSVVSYLTSL